MSDCIFCKVVSGEIQAKKVLETDDIVAFHDLAPQAPVHVLVIPKQHVAKFADLAVGQSEIIGRVMTGVRQTAEVLGLNTDSYRIVINNGERAGQSVFHLHVHLLSGRDFQWPPG